jgi:signal transduction histidine kinase
VHSVSLSRLRPRFDAPWLELYIAARLVAAGIAVALLVWGGTNEIELALAAYGPLSTLLLARFAGLRASPWVWTADFAVTLTLVVASGDWRSPFYLMWLASLALPATHLRLAHAVLLAVGACAAFLAAAVIGGPAPGHLQLISTETLAIHLSLPLLLVCSLAYAAEALRRLGSERLQRERLAIEAERRRIAWELHDSAKQRLHAAHLLVSSLQGRVPEGLDDLVGRATIELESAASDMDTSLAELRSPLEGRRLDEALRARVGELAPSGMPRVRVQGSAPELEPLIGAHTYRIACEAITNALRHADAANVTVELDSRPGAVTLLVTDDGRGLPESTRPAANGLLAMRSRAATIGARLDIRPGPHGTGTVVELRLPAAPGTEE